VEACRELAPQRGSMAKPMRVLICGIPNVGKSTLINTLVGARKAKTGDEAGITRSEQRIVLADGFYLWDTPGMLWPRIVAPQSGCNLQTVVDPVPHHEIAELSSQNGLRADVACRFGDCSPQRLKCFRHGSTYLRFIHQGDIVRRNMHPFDSTVRFDLANERLIK